ncbi:fused signal recognition particle receptor [Fibrobacter intestinalis]|uniref:Signal recognition particle receptor FtsY n=1 Tax=Fibrobacter intestinalis TaxID=28122 RepID=A0A1M6VEZ0_9BACT|nr:MULTISPECIES: signal recognition particle-docking protein FtsY [Fibrobacter]MDD7298038.1 signal recognition particle-docking protein FtsY [Fibrobacter intestinalis]PBC74497.1 fused signal recognition particle receptor [Fibrobacter sp. NR9]SHK80040.1 fused signal recognition particle receptor [Fibrobacter intestinalis]SKA16121.1 signal recognition particle-docking protein FtsY [Fibrobacter intestinalis]
MGFFSAIKSGLAKTREAILGELKGIAGKGKVTDEMLEDLEERLIKADVGTSAAFVLTDALREEALGKSLSQEEVLNILRAEAERFLIDPPPFAFKGKPHVILVIGVNGAGKTTTIGKLAKKFADEGHKVMIAAADTFRAAAIEQLQVWAERSGAEFVHHAEGSDPAAVAFDACAAAKARGCDIVFIDTAGRLQNKDYLMEELAKIVRVLKKQDVAYPHDMLLVIDGNTGQNAINQAKIFNRSFPLTGLIVTKLDGTAHGGSVLSIASSLKVPILWVGMGERIDQLVPFKKAEYVDGLFKE